MKLQIERVEIFGVELPLTGSFKLVSGLTNSQKSVIVRVTATGGITGVGSIEPVGGPENAEHAMQRLREHLAPAVIGFDPTNARSMLARLDAVSVPYSDAKVAIETACVDLVAKSFGVPIYTYLGGAVTDHLELNGWIGLVPPEQAAAEAARWRSQGYKSAKIKVGGGIDADHDRVAAVRAAVGSEMMLRIDANQSYEAETSIRLAKAIAPYNLQLFEEPAKPGDLDGMARVRRKGGIPVMADETIADHASLIAVIRAEAVDYIKVGLKQQGGFRRTADVIATAEAAGIRCAVGHGFGTSISTLGEAMLASLSQNVIAGLECVGPLKMKDTITTTRIDFKSGNVVLPTAPGLGLDLDERKIDQYCWATSVVEAGHP